MAELKMFNACRRFAALESGPHLNPGGLRRLNLHTFGMRRCIVAFPFSHSRRSRLLFRVFSSVHPGRHGKPAVVMRWKTAAPQKWLRHDTKAVMHHRTPEFVQPQYLLPRLSPDAALRLKIGNQLVPAFPKS